MRCIHILILIAGILFILTSIALVIGAYVAPHIQHYGYALSYCLVASHRIDHATKYIGFVGLQHVDVMKEVQVTSANSYGIVETYLNLNYRINSTIHCYTDADDIELTFFTNNTAIAFMIICGIIGIGLFIVFVILKAKQSRRESGYIDLDQSTRIT